MISICRYTQNKQTEWDAFVKVSKNGTFLFLRAYMDYHSDRFTDHSLMYYNKKGKLIAVLPANASSKSPSNGEKRGPNTFYSHQGLTYGGFILAPRVHSTEIGEMFDITIKYLRENGFSEWYYKQMPSIYHQLPSEDDEYWLWRNGAQLNVCNLATTVPLNDSRTKLIDKCRMRRQRQAAQYGFHIDNNGSLDTIWAIIQESLMAHHKASPIHTLDEMKLLCSRLPEYIQTLTVKDCDGNEADIEEITLNENASGYTYFNRGESDESELKVTQAYYAIQCGDTVVLIDVFRTMGPDEATEMAIDDCFEYVFQTLQ